MSRTFRIGLAATGRSPEFVSARFTPALSRLGGVTGLPQEARVSHARCVRIWERIEEW